MIRLSDSALNTLHTCERKFQLERLLVSEFEKKDYPATVLGKAYGAGCQSYLAYQDKERAIFDLYMAYYPIEEDDIRTEEVAISMLLASIPTMDNILLDWEVLVYNGKPAIELSFRLNIDSTYYFVGYIDVVLQNRWNSRCAVLDVKSTSLKLHDLSPLYQNSGQLLGYSIAIDALAGEDKSEYDVLYLVGQLGSGNGFSPNIKFLTFPKTPQDRLNWFITLTLDVEHLRNMRENNVFPLRGSSCLQYMRPCVHLGTCNLHGLDEYKEEEEDTIEYDFVYDLNDVIEDHIKRITHNDGYCTAVQDDIL